MYCFLFLVFFFLSDASASHYVTQHKEGVQLLESDSQSINARSPVECLLKCQNKWKKKGFYTGENLCFCTNGNFTDAGNKASGLTGNIYSRREGKQVTYLNDFEIPGPPTPVLGNLVNIIREMENDYQLSFIAVREAYYTLSQNIIHLTASPLNDANVDGGSRVLHVYFQKDKLKIKINTISVHEMIHLVIPENQELDITIVKYKYKIDQARIKVFIDQIERYSGVKPLISPLKNVSCFAPSAHQELSPPTTNLKFTLQPPIFVKEQRSTEYATNLATLTTWPKASSPFEVSFHVKITSSIPSSFIIPLQFSEPPPSKKRIPSFYINSQDQIGAFFPTKSGVDYNMIGNWQSLTQNVYHQCVLKQVHELSNGKFYVQFFIDGVLAGQRENEIPNTVYNDVKLKVGHSDGKGEYYIKKLDYSD